MKKLFIILSISLLLLTGCSSTNSENESQDTSKEEISSSDKKTSTSSNQTEEEQEDFEYNNYTEIVSQVDAVIGHTGSTDGVITHLITNEEGSPIYFLSTIDDLGNKGVYIFMDPTNSFELGTLITVVGEITGAVDSSIDGYPKLVQLENVIAFPSIEQKELLENDWIKDRIKYGTENSVDLNDPALEDKSYSLGEEWIIEGQWKLKIDSVQVTEDRNQFSDTNPAQVVIISYTYENLGYEDEVQDLFITPDTVIDGSKEVASIYPAKITKTPKSTPVGTICEGAQVAYGLSEESAEITVIFKKHDTTYNIKKGIFVVPVEP